MLTTFYPQHEHLLASPSHLAIDPSDAASTDRFAPADRLASSNRLEELCVCGDAAPSYQHPHHAAHMGSPSDQHPSTAASHLLAQAVALASPSGSRGAGPPTPAPAAQAGQGEAGAAEASQHAQHTQHQQLTLHTLLKGFSDPQLERSFTSYWGQRIRATDVGAGAMTMLYACVFTLWSAPRSTAVGLVLAVALLTPLFLVWLALWAVPAVRVCGTTCVWECGSVCVCVCLCACVCMRVSGGRSVFAGCELHMPRPLPATHTSTSHTNC